MPARHAFRLFDSPWDIQLMAQCHRGTCRFDDFRRTLGISRQVLASRLRELVADGLLVREQYQERPDRYEYRLTEMGRDLSPVLEATKQWCDRWRGEPGAQVPVAGTDVPATPRRIAVPSSAGGSGDDLPG